MASSIGRLALARGFRGWSPAWIGPDLVAGVTLAAIAIPAQMATARLAGLPPQTGFLAFLGASLAFAIFGSSRYLSSGADTTITPIFAGALASLAAVGSSHYAALAAGLALLTGALVAIAGRARMGWVGSLLSAPVMTGFLAGISIHILASQAPSALGLPAPAGGILQVLLRLAAEAPKANGYDLAIAIAVLAVIAGLERVNRRIPGALVALAGATGVTIGLDLQARGVARLGALAGEPPHLALPNLPPQDWLHLLPLALLVASVVMVQTAAVSHAFAPEDEDADVNGDFFGLGAGNIFAGLIGGLPVNASPPVTAMVAESGARSQAAGLMAAVIVGALLVFGMGLLVNVPTAALAGVLLSVAARLVHVGDIRRIWQQSPAEFVLVLATAAAIVVLPIEWGVAIGVGLSILHGVWSGTRVRVQPMSRAPGTTVWWPDPEAPVIQGERLAEVQVLAFPAPLTFLVADAFSREFLAAVDAEGGHARLAVLEAAGMVMIDYTAARALSHVVRECRGSGCDFALARLESPAAQAALTRLGLRALIGDDHIFESVAEAIDALAPDAKLAGGAKNSSIGIF
ncbi:MAG TPA: SulP family inorganic anion transporter [Caulobacteraceae bacterium]|nr:SulP family inorganic anion transporter [Caulobacteraceae bacterium]